MQKKCEKIWWIQKSVIPLQCHSKVVHSYSIKGDTAADLARASTKDGNTPYYIYRQTAHESQPTTRAITEKKRTSNNKKQTNQRLTPLPDTKARHREREAKKSRLWH